ncbi:MAG TPA: autotransporter outer membrane beta-barrel domain-containing protein, partial [Luteolibacter sp.]
VAETATSSIDNLGRGGVDIATGGVVNIATTGAFSFNSELTGAGTLNASNNNAAFSFGAGAGTAFVGKVNLTNNPFDLSGASTAALTNAVLVAGTGNVTTVGNGVQAIGAVDINGGTVQFSASTLDQTVADGHITTSNLDVSHVGTVSIDLPPGYVVRPPSTPNVNNLLTHDEGDVGMQLVSADSVTGSAGALALTRPDGTIITAASSKDIIEGGNTVAVGTYDYRLSTGTASDGLYVNYGLNQLELLAGQTLTFAEDTGATGASADMSAKITGTGNLAIAAGAGIVSLSNALNDYSGETRVTSGTLRSDADNALGQTSQLNLANAATFDLNGYTQTIGALDALAGSTLDLNDGILNITNGGTSVGALTGDGVLNVNGGALDVTGANTGLLADTNIAIGATVSLDNVNGLGSSAIANAGTLELDGVDGILDNVISGAGAVNLTNDADVRLTVDNSGMTGSWNILDAASSLTASVANNLGTAAVNNDGTLIIDTSTDWTLANAVSGTGNLVKKGMGTLTAGNRLTYTGKTDINAGMLVVGDTLNPNTTLGGAGAGDVTVANGATLAGLRGTINGRVVNNGTLAALNTLPGHETDPVGTFTLANGLVNSGTVNLAGAKIGNVLVVKGDYVGADGTLILKTFKGDDTSATDKLVLDGGHASGNTDLVIKHGGGEGALTTNGIRLVDAQNGATTEADAFSLSESSDGYRATTGDIAAGAFNYRLMRGGVDGQDWFLTSVEEESYRAEVGVYFNNRLFAQTMQFHTLQDREVQKPKRADGDPGNPSDADAWLRVSGTTTSREGVMSSTDNTYMVHVGTDMGCYNIDDGSLTFGMMGAYGSSHNRSEDGSTRADGTVEGYNVGLYGTWHGKRDLLTGPYVDGWLMYGAFNNEVEGEGLATESYNSDNLAASLETGYSFQFYSDENTKAYIEPQFQVIMSQYGADPHTEENGTVVSGQSGTSLTTRVGVRMHADVKGVMRPFAALNWWHGPSSQSIDFDSVTVSDELPSDRIEGKLGMQFKVNEAVSVSGSVGVETDVNDYAMGKAQFEVRYTW